MVMSKFKCPHCNRKAEVRSRDAMVGHWCPENLDRSKRKKWTNYKRVDVTEDE